MKLRAILILLAFPAILIAQTQPSTEPTAFDELRSALDEITRLPLVKLARVQDAAKLTLVDGNLVVTTTANDTDGIARLGIANFPGANTLRIEKPIRDGTPQRLELMHRKASGDAYAIMSVMITPGRVSLTHSEESPRHFLNVELMQSEEEVAQGEPGVRLYVNLMNGEETVENLKLSANSVEQLRRENAHVADKYLEPIFREFQQPAVLSSVDLKVAWQIFADAAKPDDAVTSQVEKLIKDLDADTYPAREAASQSLEKLGQPAALVLMKNPPKNLSEEQRNRIDVFLTAYRPLTTEQADALRASPQFLMDCMQQEDEAIRAAAAAQLAKVTKQTIDFDPRLTGEARLKAVSALRASLTPKAATSAPASRVAP